MTRFDWGIVFGLNLLVFGFAAFRSLRTRTDVDWFLGGRSLPFWIAGLSMFATSVDGGEYVTINGATYRDGIAMLIGIVFGVGVGGIITAFLVVPKMYRGGLFTNAEYLETRYGPSSRIISVLVQIQYRTSVLATIVVALHMVLTEVAQLETRAAWVIIVALTAATTTYAAWGGLKTVAVTDALLSVMMLSATFVLWLVIWRNVGGWHGARELLIEQEGASTAETLLHIGRQRTGQSHPVIIVLGWCLISTGYFVVNHTQTMKMLGARSLWDLKMSVVVGTGLIMLSGHFSSSLGVFGRALMPGLQDPDVIYPRLVDQYLSGGLKGVVVAGVVASAISTFEGIGAALSALFTRDLYARYIATRRSEAHYLMVSRLATVVIVAASFLYVPFILKAPTIIDFFVRITSVFVTPLMTVYLMGALTRVDRRSALVGLIVGPCYGMAAALWGSSGAQSSGLLPYWLTEKFAAYLWSTGITATSMIVASLIVSRFEFQEAVPRDSVGWLTQSQQKISEYVDHPFGRRQGPPWWAHPNMWAAIVLTAAGIVVFVVLW